MSIIAIRRNLAPGAVFFRQTGNDVEYSLDMLTWELAFVLPGPASIMTPSVMAAVETMTIQQFQTFVQSQFTGSVTVANLSNVLDNSQSKIRQNLCAAAQALAAVFVALVNVHLEDEQDEELGLLAAAGNVVSGALEIAKLRFKLAGGALKWINRVIVGGVATDAAATWYESLDGVPDLTECDIQQIACAIYRASLTSGADKEAIAGALINHFDFAEAAACGPSNMTVTLTEWFSVWIEDWPELWSAYLAALTDQEIAECNCGGCHLNQAIVCDINTYTGGYPTGYPLLNGSVRTIPARTWATPGNEKQLSLRYYLPPGQAGSQIDQVKLWYVTTGYLYQSGLPAWGAQAAINVRLGGPGSTQDFNVPYNQLPNTNGPQEITIDTTSATLYQGVTYIDMRHIINRTANSAVNDTACDTAMVQFEYCLRGP